MDESVIDRLRDPGDSGFLPDDVGAVLAAYDESMAFADKATAKISDLEMKIAAAEEEIAKLKAVNYDLIMAQPKSSDMNDSEDKDNTSNDSDNDDDEPSIEKISAEAEKGDDE